MNAKVPVTVSEVLERPTLSALQIRILLICGFVVLLDGYDIQTMALAVPSIQSAWSLPRAAFAWVLTAAPVGMALGAIFLAPLGDRIGRRAVMIAMPLVAGAASLATITATDLNMLLVYRFLTGLGLGATLPNATTITSEFMPAARRSSLVTVMYSNVAIGALLAGFTAPQIIGWAGWHGIFIVGGVLPIVLGLTVALGVPESLNFLARWRPGDRRIAKIVAQIAPEYVTRTLAPDPEPKLHRVSIMALLQPSYRARTLLLWGICAMNLFVLYFLISWLPTLLRAAGWSAAKALPGGVMIQAGGVVAGLMVSWLIDRGRTVAGMSTFYGIAAVALALFIVLPSVGIWWWILLFLVGGGTSGTQFALNALSARFYPPVIRATGVGSAIGIGRLGAILGPLCGGAILALQLTLAQVLALLVAPVALCAVGVMLLPLVWKPEHGDAAATR